MNVAIASPIRCNRCQSKFEAPKAMVRNAFWGQAAARILDFCTCPKCSQTDNHYVYASDIMPVFEGSPGKIRRLQDDWMSQN